MTARDGDGWVDCQCGNRHWGLHGSAGMLLVRNGSVLLQHRAPWVHNGDTWGIPGGARDSHETVLEAALREGAEEIGLNAEFVTPLQVHDDDHGDWRYDTVIAKADDRLIAHEMNEESLQVEWVKYDDVTSKNLHPSFAHAWPKLKVLLAELFM
ncbi:MAG: NUDIX hydrolase [Actinomycetes bacterium]